MKCTTNMTVRGYHIDHFGHVNHGRYIEILEEARWQYLEQNRLIDAFHQLGTIHVVGKLEIEYRHPARVGNHLLVETWVACRTSYGFTMSQDIFMDKTGKLVVNARVANVFVDLHGRPKPIDEKILEFWPELAAVNNMDELRSSNEK